MVKPPDDLRDWSKNDLVREVKRLRALVFENAKRARSDNRPQGDPVQIDLSVARQMGAQGDPYARGSIMFDAREAVLMDSIDVALVDTKRGGDGGLEELVLAMTLAGRINFSDRRSETLYMFDGDGAAGIISQLMGLAVRVGPEFATNLMKRLEELP